MTELFESGRIVDLVLVLVVAEVAVLAVLWRRTGTGVAPLSLLMNVGAGVSLMLALRASLTGAGWTAIAGWLVASLVFHAADLARRWRRARDG